MACEERPSLLFQSSIGGELDHPGLINHVFKHPMLGRCVVVLDNVNDLEARVPVASHREANGVSTATGRETVATAARIPAVA
ncbi:MAG: hypothetical protein ABSB35_31180 [Bryobacteraceae bacterium]|jgi:hypothetical protein